MTELMNSPEKVAMIRDVAESWPDHRCFVETGTAVGDLPFGTLDIFDRIVTVEMDQNNYHGAVGRLLPHDHVRVIHGDAGVWLGPILDALEVPCVIWLDAHEIADDGTSSMAAEFEALTFRAPQHVIMVDDARLCSGRKGWLTLAAIEDWAAQQDYAFHGVTDDVVLLTP